MRTELLGNRGGKKVIRWEEEFGLDLKTVLIEGIKVSKKITLNAPNY